MKKRLGSLLSIAWLTSLASCQFFLPSSSSGNASTTQDRPNTATSETSSVPTASVSSSQPTGTDVIVKNAAGYNGQIRPNTQALPLFDLVPPSGLNFVPLDTALRIYAPVLPDDPATVKAMLLALFGIAQTAPDADASLREAIGFDFDSLSGQAHFELATSSDFQLTTDLSAETVTVGAKAIHPFATKKDTSDPLVNTDMGTFSLAILSTHDLEGQYGSDWSTAFLTDLPDLVAKGFAVPLMARNQIYAKTLSSFTVTGGSSDFQSDLNPNGIFLSQAIPTDADSDKPYAKGRFWGRLNPTDANLYPKNATVLDQRQIQWNPGSLLADARTPDQLKAPDWDTGLLVDFPDSGTDQVTGIISYENPDGDPTLIQASRTYQVASTLIAYDGALDPLRDDGKIYRDNRKFASAKVDGVDGIRYTYDFGADGNESHPTDPKAIFSQKGQFLSVGLGGKNPNGVGDKGFGKPISYVNLNFRRTGNFADAGFDISVDFSNQYLGSNLTGYAKTVRVDADSQTSFFFTPSSQGQNWATFFNVVLKDAFNNAAASLTLVSAFVGLRSD